MRFSMYKCIDVCVFVCIICYLFTNTTSVKRDQKLFNIYRVLYRQPMTAAAINVNNTTTSIKLLQSMSIPNLYAFTSYFPYYFLFIFSQHFLFFWYFDYHDLWMMHCLCTILLSFIYYSFNNGISKFKQLFKFVNFYFSRKYCEITVRNEKLASN